MANRPAVVMNMFYTGLGIARSLGELGVPVIGLTTARGIYGCFCRYAKIVRVGDSQSEAELLLRQLIDLGKQLGLRSILFPTRDHDVVFLDRYRDELAPYFLPVIPGPSALEQCLNKWETHTAAKAVGVAAPKA